METNFASARKTAFRIAVLETLVAAAQALRRQTRLDVSVEEMLKVLLVSESLRICPTGREEARIYLKEPAGFLVSFGELTELRQACSKDAPCRQSANLFLAENPDRLGIPADGVVREAKIPVVPTRRLGVEAERILGQLEFALAEPSVPKNAMRHDRALRHCGS